MKTTRLITPLGCGDCSRRALLRGLGIAAVGTLVVAAGCQSSGSSASTATATVCGGGHCVDLGDAANSELATVGGAMLLDTSTDTIMVIRAADNQVIALSAICTHAGCAMDYSASQRLMDCACHGSQFSTTGAVVRGPANRPIRVYSATLASNVITIAAS
ncbi:MAG: Rieske 2Fe-2S domain-containing protein [Kofleriaceae bacterium]